MTVTLHWWLVPVALVAFGLVCLVVDERRGGYLSGILGGVVLLVCLASAIAFTAGRFL